jgi:hypothetical protein
MKSPGIGAIIGQMAQNQIAESVALASIVEACKLLCRN